MTGIRAPGANSLNNGTGVRSLVPGNGAVKRTGSVGTSYGTLGSGTASRTARNLISRYTSMLTCCYDWILMISSSYMEYLIIQLVVGLCF